MAPKLSAEVKGVSKGLLVSLVLCLLSAPLVYYTGIRETILPALGNFILAAGVFWAACYVSKTHGNKGLVRGITTGITFFILILIATFAVNSAQISFNTLIYTIALCLAAGGLGGIFGIGLSDKSI